MLLTVLRARSNPQLTKGSAAATSCPVMGGCWEHMRSKARGMVARPKNAWARPLKVWTSLLDNG